LTGAATRTLDALLLGCIDIGSNTTRLLVADAHAGGLRTVLNERVFTRLGRSVLPGGEIPGSKILETAEVVAAQAYAAQEAGAREVTAVATAAIRKAPNRGELAAAVEEAGGMPLWVLSPDEEARLSFVGATATMREPGEGTIAVVDIGGGSTELALGTIDHGVTWSDSWDIGSGLLADAYLRSEPPTPEELDAVRGHVEETFRGVDPPAADSAVAVGGTATSLRRLAGRSLSPKSLERVISALTSEPIDEAAARFELDPERVRLLPAGILVLEALSERLGLRFRVARGGLREGVLLELVQRRRAA
jgi:exopolyphosphatase/guanosine-5'-triphosphate,3'-diphosphate pyrophosphatase